MHSITRSTPRRSQSARPDEQDLRRLQLLLSFNADLRNDQVPAVTQNLFLRERGFLGRRCHGRRRGAGGAGRGAVSRMKRSSAATTAAASSSEAVGATIVSFGLRFM